MTFSGTAIKPQVFQHPRKVFSGTAIKPQVLRPRPGNRSVRRYYAAGFPAAAPCLRREVHHRKHQRKSHKICRREARAQPQDRGHCGSEGLDGPQEARAHRARVLHSL